MILSLKDLNSENFDEEVVLAKMDFWIFGDLEKWHECLERLAFGC